MFLAVEWTGRHVLLQLSSDISIFCFIYHKGSVVGCFLVHEVIVVAWLALKLTTCAAKGNCLFGRNTSTSFTICGDCALDFGFVHGNFSFIAESYISWDCFHSLFRNGANGFTHGTANNCLGVILSDK